MNCHVVFWFEAAYLVTLGLISWRIAKLTVVGRVAFLVVAVTWIAVGIAVFWIVEFIAVFVATGGYAQELGFCPPGSVVSRMGEYILLWIPLFCLACSWVHFSAKRARETGRKG